MNKEKRINYKEVYKSLLLLQEICKSCKQCSECVFYSDNREDTVCGLLALAPAQWEINRPPEYDFKFFAKRGD